MGSVPETSHGDPRLERRPAGSGFVESLGERIALFGAEQGPLELWMWPLKIASELTLTLASSGARPRAVEVTPDALVFVFEEKAFRLQVRAIASRTRAGLVLVATLQGAPRARLALEFRCDFRPMWPAGLGGQLSGVDAASGAFYLSEELGRFAFLIGTSESAGATPVVPATDHGLPQGRVSIPLDVEAGVDAAYVLAGATVEPRALEEAQRRGAGQAATGTARSRFAVEAARKLLCELADDWGAEEQRNRAHWSGFLARTTTISTPNHALDEAFLWSKIALERAWVSVDAVGRGLVAGIGPSAGGERPGYAWFFDGDAMCAARALVAAGDCDGPRSVLRAAAQRQREDGKFMHELSLAAGLCDWVEDYPYAYYKGLNTPDFVACLAHYVSWSGDLELARELWGHVLRAVTWCEACLDSTGRLSNRSAGIAAVEAGDLADRIESDIFLHGAWIAALKGAARLARRLGEPHARFDARLIEALRALGTFYSEERGRYGFAQLTDGALMDELSVYVARPLAEGDGTPLRAHATLFALNRPELAADWGVRMFATDSEVYDPSSYNTGAVFPYLTSFLTLAQYRHAHAGAAWQLLASQARLVHRGGLGLLEEHYPGDRATRPARGVPHQIFSSSGIVECALQGLFGIDPDASRGVLDVRPTPPAHWNEAQVRGLRVGQAHLDLHFWQSDEDVGLRVVVCSPSNAKLPRVRFSPVLPPLSVVEGVASHTTASGAVIVNALEVSGEARIAVRRGPSLILDGELPEDGGASRAPRIIAREVREKRVVWTLAGRAGSTARIAFHCGRPCSVRESELEVVFPAGRGWTQARVTVEVE